MQPTLLIVTTTNWVPTARLAIALRRAGFRVEALCPPGHPIGETNAASLTYLYSGLRPLLSLRLALAAAKPDLVVPGDDLAARHLHQLYRERGEHQLAIGSLIERSLGSPESFPIVGSRAAFMQVAREEGIRVPGAAVIESEAEVMNWVSEAGFPTVLKADGTSGGEGVRIVRTVVEAQAAYRKLLAPAPLAKALKRALLDHDRNLVIPSLLRRRPTVSGQSFIAGHEATSTIACWRGKVLAGLHFEVLRKSHAEGHATVVRWIDHAEMTTAVEKIVRRMGLSGLCGFDFMLEAATGNAYLIEINPRATQVGHLTLGAGRDLPAALFGAATGQESRSAAALTANPTIALFPHEWARDPGSEFLRGGYHDVPWETPELVHACMRRSRQQSAWYARGRKQPAAEQKAAGRGEMSAPASALSSAVSRPVAGPVSGEISGEVSTERAATRIAAR